MKIKNIYTTLLILLSGMMALSANAQSYHQVQNLPYADQKLYHLGFYVGIHTQDLVMKNTGTPTSTGEVWFADVPSYSPGFSVGFIADRYINQYLNVRFSPGLHFGEKKFAYREQSTGEKYEKAYRSNYITAPLHIKFSGGRIHNARPYFLFGGYGSWALGNKKDEAIRFENMDYGLDFGIGCNIYLKMFKLCPELRFSLGLADVVNQDTSDLTDMDMLKYRNAVKSGKTRMISLIFNFE
ncbi:porin family protein [Dysgonomonas sp. 25]|uniref:type IX secretion/gliding motility protein PorT/SprT n=1 Tax=Dysgonomonas sp. 25 TaxID=2302933 RepID=UPI0013D64935|nr:porin family protein [Dysgonomonas sp. 25]NDV67526.1 PorT family protein [Dysgonomonas sp. 25]